MASKLLTANTYVHVINQDTGSVQTEIGPQRVVLKGNEKFLGERKDCHIIKKGEFAILKNPFDEVNNVCKMGERKVIIGPSVYSLKYKEVKKKKILLTSKFSLKEFETYATPAYLLNSTQALRCETLEDNGDLKAGDVWQVKGPISFIPDKYTNVIKIVDSILINDNQGIYVINTMTSEKKLVKGPQSYLLTSEEELYEKKFSGIEIKALKLSSKPSHIATVITLLDGDVLCVLDSEKKEKIEIGPGFRILGPEEQVKVLYLSAKKPKIPNQIKAAVIKKGPSFMSDIFIVSTRDNCQLKMHCTYKWEFIVDRKQSNLIFSTNDFIGYACNTLCSRIREEAASFNFEEFHNKTVKILRDSLFKDNEISDSNGNKTIHFGLFFEEINLLISEIDIRNIEPTNQEISKLLHESIKSNMRMVCSKLEQEANMEAKKLNIKAQEDIQKIRQKLLEIQNKNLKLETVEKAKIEGLALIEKAKAENEAKNLIEQSSFDLDYQKMNNIIQLLSHQDGMKYLNLQKIINLSEIKQTWYVNSDSKMDLLN